MRYKTAVEMERFLRPKPVVAPKTGWTIPLFTDFSKPIVLIGPSGIGKTQFAKACLPGALFARHVDSLKSVQDWSNGVIFDDMDFSQWPRVSQIHLVDQEEDSEIHVRYSTVIIPANTKKIFCCNERPFIVDPAIDRRITVVNMHEQLFRLPAPEEPRLRAPDVPEVIMESPPQAPRSPDRPATKKAKVDRGIILPLSTSGPWTSAPGPLQPLDPGPLDPVHFQPLDLDHQ